MQDLNFFQLQDGKELPENEMMNNICSSKSSSARHEFNQFDMKNSMEAWYRQFAEKQFMGLKRSDSFDPLDFYETTHPVTQMGVQLAQLLTRKLLKLNTESLQELEKVDTYDFDIFNLRKSTDGNELSTLVPYLLAKHGLVRTNDVDFNKLLCFVRHLAPISRRKDWPT